MNEAIRAYRGDRLEEPKDRTHEGEFTPGVPVRGCSATSLVRGGGRPEACHIEPLRGTPLH